MTDKKSSWLASQHQKIDQEISAEQKRPRPDDSVIHALKKKKLSIKDQIAFG